MEVKESPPKIRLSFALNHINCGGTAPGLGAWAVYFGSLFVLDAAFRCPGVDVRPTHPHYNIRRIKKAA